MKLVPKDTKIPVKTTVWCAEDVDGTNVRRKQFSIYGATIKDVEAILLREFKEK